MQAIIEACCLTVAIGRLKYWISRQRREFIKHGCTSIPKRKCVSDKFNLYAREKNLCPPSAAAASIPGFLGEVI